MPSLLRPSLGLPSFLLALLAPSALACGAVAEDGGGPAGTNDDLRCGLASCKESNPDPPPALAGSRLLVFSEVTRSDGGTTSMVPLGTQRAAVGNLARLDIERGAAGAAPFVAHLTPRWGTRSALTVSVQADAVVLSGKVSFGLLRESNTFTEIRLERDATGALSNAFTAVGELSASAGDVVDSFAVKGKGALRADDLPPEMRIAPPPKSRDGLWLPWDTLQVDLAEPLPVGAIFPALTTALPEAGWPARVEKDVPNVVTGYFGQAQTFATVNGVSRTVVAPTGVADPSNNALVPFTGAFRFRDVGEARAAHDFDADSSGATWGNLTRVADERCESGGCLALTIDNVNSCPTPSGFAARLAPGHAIKKVRVRARLLAADREGSSGAPLVPSVLRFSATTPSGQVAVGEPSSANLTRTGEDSAYPWSTPWQDVDITPPDSAAEVGFHVVPPICDSLGGLPFPNGKVMVLIDSVKAE